MQTNVEILKCSECGATISHTVRHNGFQSGGTSIGPSTIPCPGCGSFYWTGKSEWTQKGFFQKSWFILNRLLWAIVASFFVAGFLAVLVAHVAVDFRFIRAIQRGLCMLIVYGIGTTVLVGLLMRNAIKEIRESCQRTADGQIFVISNSSPKD